MFFPLLIEFEETLRPTCYTPERTAPKFFVREDNDARRRLCYKGAYPRKFIPENINYLDHNILELGNRMKAHSSKKNELFYDSMDTVFRRKTPLAVRRYISYSLIIERNYQKR